MIVMKFGGTSVQDAKAIDRVAHIVQGRLADRPVVVVSAMAKVTDSLLAMGKAAGSGDRKTALKMARALRERHYETAGELLGTALFTEFHGDLGADFEDLDELLRGIGAVGEITPRTYDYVASFGEVLSSKIVAAAFVARGLPGAHVDSRQCLLTDSSYTRAVPQFDETNERLRKRVKPLLDSGKVPVMGGFIGSNRAGITTTIGRGGSDFSAAIFGAGLNAERIEIWTDVDGMMTTDPRLCPDARRIKVISFDEAAELAYFGAKVLHPATVLPAIQQEYSGLRSELAEPDLRRDEDHGARPALYEYFQGHRAQEKDHPGRGRVASPPAGARILEVDLRGLRSAQRRGGRGFHFRSQRFGDGRDQRSHPRAGRRPGKNRGRKVRGPEGDRLPGG